MRLKKFSTKLLLVAAITLILAGGIRIWWANQAKPVILPNGFVLIGDSLLLPDRKSILASDLEFLCFDDRFVVASSKTAGQGGLFDGLTGGRTELEVHPEIYQPGGLKFGQGGCNGYYTALIGPGLLIDGNRPPFLPSCSHVNHKNPALRDKAWLNRPCTDR